MVERNAYLECVRTLGMIRICSPLGSYTNPSFEVFLKYVAWIHDFAVLPFCSLATQHDIYATCLTLEAKQFRSVRSLLDSDSTTTSRTRGHVKQNTRKGRIIVSPVTK